MVKRILKNCISLAVLFVLMNFVYDRWFYESDIQKYSDILNLVRVVPNDADIIYLGESSNITTRYDDKDKRPISAFLGDHFPNLHTYDITKPASHAGIYKVLLENIPEENQVKTVVVTLNLRSFNAQWIYSNLETPLQKSLMLIKPYPPLVNRFLLSFKTYDIKTDKEREQQFKEKWGKEILKFPFNSPYSNVIEWDYGMATTGIKDANGHFDPSRTQLACHYIKAYAFQIDTLTNPRIKDFDAIVKYAHKRGWNLVFNLMAENTVKAQKLVGDDLLFLIDQNAKLLVDYYSRKGVKVIDNLNAVPDDQFVDQDWTTEHYAENGRKIVARNVALALKPLFPGSYVDVADGQEYQTQFFNNCENGVVWGQMGTVTSEKSCSGNKSSVTGCGNNFSITLEYPLRIIPDSMKNEMEVEFNLYQHSLTHDAKIVMEASGESFGYYWCGWELKQQTTKLDEWQKYRNQIIIPDSIRNADVIKVYVYNTSNEKVFIDDFSIRFQ